MSVAEALIAFSVAAFILTITPGLDNALVLRTAAVKGSKRAWLASFGVCSGTLVWGAAVALGLSALLEASAVAFNVLRWVGAAYLIWLGVQAWRHAGANGAMAAPRGHVHFWRGITVALSNPKTIAFFTAFLPQFVDPSLPAGRQLAVMCAVSVALAAVTDSIWAVAAGLGRAWFMQSWRAKLLGRLSGIALIGGGVWLSLARRPG